MAHAATGSAALLRFFEPGVRQRAMRYVGTGAIQVVESTASLLVALVKGRKRYCTAFGRSGSSVRYACTCPYFEGSMSACKHLYALVLQESRAPLVTSKSGCAELVPDAALVDESEGWTDDEWELLEDSDESEDDFYESEGATRDYTMKLPAGRRAAAETWRDVAARVALAGASRAAPPTELVYFLDLELATSGVRVVVAQRGKGAAPDSFNPVQRWEAESLVHEVDRELSVLFQASSAPSSLYYSSAPACSIVPSRALVPKVLELLARSGRCHVVPASTRDERGAEWSQLTAGRPASPKVKEKLGLDYGKLLAWPLLTRDTGDEYGLCFEVIERRVTGKGKKRLFDVRAQLFRGDERRDPMDVRYVHRDGWVLVGERLARCERSDAPWLESAARQRSLGQVSEDALPELVERVFGHRGVSGLSLPPDFSTNEPAPQSRPVLELDAPVGKKVVGKVAFDYAGQRLGAEAGAMLVLTQGKAWDRPREAEREALATLARLGFTGSLLGNAPKPEGGRVSLEERALAPALHELLAQGWLVEGEGKRYRASAGFTIEVESGIDWFEVKGAAKFEGGEVPFPKLLEAIRQRRRVVRLGDGSFGVLPEEWMERWGLVAELAGHASGDAALRVSSRQIGLLQALLTALPEQDSGARGIRALRERLDRFRDVKPGRPARGFQGKLRPYQAHGLGWLAALGELGFGACLADDMGLGKTVQVLAHLHAERRARGADAKSTLVVVPRSLLSNWIDEAKRFAPQLSVRQHWGTDRARTKDALGDADLVLTTYGTLRADIALFSEVELECVVLDEAQTIKNRQSATAKCVKVLRTKRRIAMTGTPIENHLGELWSLFEFLNPGLLQELPALRRALDSAKPTEETQALVRVLVRPFVLRRTKREVAKDLPERVEQTLFVDLEPSERERYDELFRHYQASIAKKVGQVGVERATPHLLEALLRLRQASCHPGLVDEALRSESSAKVECLVERLRALCAEGHRALIFSQFTSLLAIVRQRLTDEGITFEYLDGKTRDRAAAVERFQSNPSIHAFLISLKAGGVGLNLTAADYVFILDPWWNPAAEAQAIDRAHRIGQARNVIAYRLLAKGTVEERVAQLQAQKRELIAGIMGDDRSLAQRLTRGDLEALLSLTTEQGAPLSASSDHPHP